MKTILIYLAQVIVISGLLYGYYHFFLRNKKFHHYNRYYLLSATLLSLLIPFFNIPVYFSQSADQSVVIQALTRFSPSITTSPSLETETAVIIANNGFDWLIVPQLLFFFIAGIILFRLIISLFKIRQLIRDNPHEKIETIQFVNTLEPGTPYSFFRWLFWHRDIDLASAKGKQIFRHELFHINQKHSIDIVFLEILFVPFFLNPFFWLIKKELGAIHEFLADRYAVSENNKWDYAELLLMQTLNTKQSLVNPFFHNQIKRRIAMITASQQPRHQYLRKLMVLPLTLLAVLLFSFNYQYKNKKARIGGLAQPITVIIDAGHGGEDNGAIGTDGTKEKELTISIAKRIKSLNEDENIRIILTRNTDILPSLKSRTDLSNKEKADLFLSIHINSSPDKTKTSFEVLVSGKSNSWNAENNRLASIIMGNLQGVYPTVQTTSERKNGIWVLENNNCPSALIECGYISNDKDLGFIKDPANQDKIAKGILSAIIQFGNQKNNSADNEAGTLGEDTLRKKLVLIQYGGGKYGGS